MNVLFVVAHPDDEILGGGATMAKLIEEGHNVDVCVLNTFDVTAYADKEEHQKRLIQTDKSYGVRKLHLGE